MAAVVVGRRRGPATAPEAPGPRLDAARPAPQPGPLQGLALGLLVHAEHHRALRRGSRYSPTTSVSLASKSGSLESLNASTRHGSRLRAPQMRATVSLPTPWRAAIDLVDQCVEPSAGRRRSVSSTIASTVSGAIWRLRPRPGATTPTPAGPSRANRRRHARTVSESTEWSRAVPLKAPPRPHRVGLHPRRPGDRLVGLPPQRPSTTPGPAAPPATATTPTGPSPPTPPAAQRSSPTHQPKPSCPHPTPPNHLTDRPLAWQKPPRGRRGEWARRSMGVARELAPGVFGRRSRRRRTPRRCWQCSWPRHRLNG